MARLSAWAARLQSLSRLRADTGLMAYTDAEVDSWVDASILIYGNNVGTVSRDLEQLASEAAANMMSASGFREAPTAITQMFDRLIMAGYAQALNDVKTGTYDCEIPMWRDLEELADGQAVV